MATILLSNYIRVTIFNPVSANPTKWSNTLKEVVPNLPTNCLSVFDHFVKLALKGLIGLKKKLYVYVYVYTRTQIHSSKKQKKLRKIEKQKNPKEEKEKGNVVVVIICGKSNRIQ